MTKEKMTNAIKWGVSLLYVVALAFLGKILLIFGLLPLIVLIAPKRKVLLASLFVLILCFTIAIDVMFNYPTCVCGGDYCHCQNARGLLLFSILMTFYNLFVILYCFKQDNEKKYFMEKSLYFLWILFFFVSLYLVFSTLAFYPCNLFGSSKCPDKYDGYYDHFVEDDVISKSQNESTRTETSEKEDECFPKKYDFTTDELEELRKKGCFNDNEKPVESETVEKKGLDNV